MKNCYLLLSVSVLFSILSCTDNLNLYNETESSVTKKNSILHFDSNESLSRSIETGSNETKSTANENLPEGESLFEQMDYKETMNEYVPNPEFAKLLNREGEIVVGDYIYKITSNGTYYFDRDKKDEFASLYEKDNQINGTKIKDKLYQISEGIYRYDTFYKEEGETNYVEKNNLSDEGIQTKSGHSTGSDPDIESLDWFTADRTTWLGKIVQNLFGSSKEFAKYYPHTDKRRVKGSFYFYNYVAYAETGVHGWTDKKNWIGWSKTASEDLRVGWRNVVLVTKLPDAYQKSIKSMTNLSRSVSPVQKMDIPGTMYEVNLKTMVIPDFDATQFDKVLTIGAKSAFNWLKSLCPQNQSDWEKAEAVLVVSRTHLYTFFPDQDVQKLNCESYTHVFASQLKFTINVNPLSFPQTITEYGKLLADIVKNSSKMAYPTLANGDMYVAAKFAPYWQGMRIKKKTSEVITTMGLK